MVSRRELPVEIDPVEAVLTTEVDRILAESFSGRIEDER